MQNHYDFIAHMNALVTSGDNKTPLYYALREAFRKANMKGSQITSLDRLKVFIAPWAYAQVAAAMGENQAAPLAA